ncbi:MAG: family 1 glycosylhydrolase, partial [Polyangiaceae bacterium]
MPSSRTIPLALLIAVAACSSDGGGASPAPSGVTFPPSFMWGTATAAFQIEKGDVHTDWSKWTELTPSKIKNGDKPDDGSPDALNHVDEDIGLMTQTGQNAYRLSIEWGRIYPTRAAMDADTPDADALAAYDSEIQKLRTAHITPMVTLQHFALPDWLSDVTQPQQPQGWERPETKDLFTQYCGRMAKHFGAQVDWWVTINEPLVTVVTGFIQGGSPPGLALEPTRAFDVARTLARAHASCFDAIHAADTTDADGDGKAAWVSVAKHERTFHPDDPTLDDDVQATAHVRYLWNLWFLNAVIRGDWDDDIDGNYTGPKDVKGDPTLANRMDYIG